MADSLHSSWLVPKGTWSSTRRSVGIGLRDVVVMGQSWVIGNGCKIRFWKDKWMLNKLLLDFVYGELPVNQFDAYRMSREIFG